VINGRLNIGVVTCVITRRGRASSGSGQRHRRQATGSGRPVTGKDPVRTMRLSDEFIVKIDTWATQQDDMPGRSEAIRRLVELGLKAKK
jgi:hypothetical protein